MAINKVTILDKIKAFAQKYNDTTDEIVVSGTVNTSNQLELVKNGGGLITIDLPFSNDKIVTGMTISVTGTGPFTATVTAGTYQLNGITYSYAGGAFPIAVVTSPNERIDIFYADNTSTVFYLAGTPSVTPTQPATPVGTLLIGVVYVNSTGAGSGPTVNVNAGFLNNQTLRWDTTSSTWLPNSNLLASTTQVGIGTALTGAKLAVNGDIELLPISAPFPTTDKLYNVSGDLYWNGGLVGLADGVTTGSHLYWNGTSWVENNILLRENTPFSVDSIQMDTTDATGVRTEMHLGNVPIAGERGFQWFVNDTLNDNNMYVLMTAQDSVNNTTTFKVNQQDTNLLFTSQFLLSATENITTITDNNTNIEYVTKQDITEGLVNIVFNPGVNSAFTVVNQNLVQSEVKNLATPTEYTLFNQTQTDFTIYKNSSNVNHIANITSLGAPGAFIFNCGIINRYKNITANYSVVENDYSIYTTIGFNPLTITLPAAPVDGRMLVIKANSATPGAPVTINGNGKLIDAAATRTLTSNFQAITLQYNNSYGRWMVI